MKYNHLLIISLTIPSIISGMEIKRKSSLSKETLTKLIYREKTVITIPNQPDSHDTSIESTDQDIVLNTDTEKKESNSPKKNKLTKQSSFERH